MICYFCGLQAQGQCHKDGRFVCRPHSAMHDGALICYACAMGNQDAILKKAVDELSRISDGVCGCCGIGLIPLEVNLSYLVSVTALDQEQKEKVWHKFAPEYGSNGCPNGCRVCVHHGAASYAGWFSNSRCLACGKKFTVV